MKKLIEILVRMSIAIAWGAGVSAMLAIITAIGLEAMRFPLIAVLIITTLCYLGAEEDAKELSNQIK